MSLNGTLKALSDPIRRNILTMLKGKKMIAGDISEELGISPASLSYHLNGGENYNAPIQRVDDFLNNRKSTHLGDVKPSIGPNYEFSNLNEILPEYVCTSMAQGIVKMGRMLHGFDDGDAVLTGVESRSSSPVRIMRKTDTLESVLIEGLYPCGEGAGYAGGIISAAVDGIKCAEKIIDKSNK